MKSAKFRIPSTSALIAFEASVRLGGVKRAAVELKTTQSAISRYIRNLETMLDVVLFQRTRRGVVSTPVGEDFYAVVKTSLENLHAVAHGLRTNRPMLTIGCTQEISVLLLLPVFSRLQRSLPNGVKVRILNCDYDMLALVVPAGIDIVFKYEVARTDAESARIMDEEIVPVASPAFARRFGRLLSGHPRHWSGVPRLELASRDQEWATWTSWFAAHECVPPQAPVESFENHIQLLEAAVNGDGMAIGWNGFVGSYFKSEQLVPLTDEWVASNLGLYAVLTPHGRRNPNAEDCLTVLVSLGKELTDGREVLVQHSIR